MRTKHLSIATKTLTQPFPARFQQDSMVRLHAIHSLLQDSFPSSGFQLDAMHVW
ncbi:hypothetical protein [Chroococcidiopsis cubana]|uniref:hypothetical protein n=1 Tax=Chroococcidiopsis cubana TaxID=171392 RepID=UPI002ACE1C7C|nr:hypothetical protein [Chroococcidiopsis cubana]